MTTKIATAAQVWLATTLAFVAQLNTRLDPEPSGGEDNDRGDVPGWVMITVMTAIVVIALLAVFREQVVNAVTNAFESVSGAG
jgi:hypothetical protein